MNRAFSGISFVSALFVFACATAWAEPKDETPPFPWEGEVTGTNVFVRSGAGNNWYPTAKLNGGDRVLVMGDKFGWYQIAPPPGSFSYIDMTMVDRKGGAKTGIVKQDKTYVRAGSKLEQRKNSTQVLLNKGAAVEIIGEADGFFQIKPPNGASLFISKQYVKPVASNMRSGLVEKHVSNPEPAAQPAPTDAASAAKNDSAAKPEQLGAAPQYEPTKVAATEPGRITLPAEPEPKMGNTGTAIPNTDSTTPPQDPTTSTEPKETTPAPKSAKAKPAKTASAKKSEPAPTTPPNTGRYKAMLTVVEGELADMSRRSFEDQDLTSLIKKYEPIANQSEENIPAQVAQIRIRQLTDRTQLKLARSELDKDTKEIEDLRANMDAERFKIMNRRGIAAMERYDIEGELKESFAFAPENRRYRIVDPQTKVTIAYVDIPASVEGNPRHLVGQLVGIKCSGKQFSASARVPIAVAKMVVDLSPRKHMNEGANQPVALPAGNEPPAEERTPADAAAAGDKPATAEPAADAGEKSQP